MLAGLVAALVMGGAPQSAQDYFAAGRQLLTEQRYAEARRAFLEAQAREPSLGALLNLGECEERLNNPVGAWQRFRAAVEWAQRAPVDSRLAYAQQRLASVEAVVARVLVDSAEEGVIVLLNGEPIPPREEVAVMPGRAEVMVRRPGGTEWTRRESLSAGVRRVVTVPKVQEALRAPVELSATPAAPSRAPYITGMVSGAALTVVGLVGVGVGLSTKRAFDTQQGGPREAATVTRAQAESAELFFWGGLGAAVLGVGVGVTSGVLWARASPDAPQVSVGVMPGGGLVMVGGAW